MSGIDDQLCDPAFVGKQIQPTRKCDPDVRLECTKDMISAKHHCYHYPTDDHRVCCFCCRSEFRRYENRGPEGHGRFHPQSEAGKTTFWSTNP